MSSGFGKQRYLSALKGLPGRDLFWEIAINESDVFAYNTVNEGKGGPFGAQLWLVNPETEQYVIVGNREHPEDSNAVVSKGRASAHAEAENLCPERRESVFSFLQNHRGEGWQVVQISSGESCPSCRAKQVLFAEELIRKGLIERGGFHVAFKATYEQTRKDADFNDAPYDETFREIARLGVLDNKKGLFALESMFFNDPDISARIKNGEMVFNPVEAVSSECVPIAAKELIEKAGKVPAAVIVSKEGLVIGFGCDERKPEDYMNLPENTAFIRALFNAADGLRSSGKFESWNLEGAFLYTNIREIGSLAYSESLWYNLSGIRVIEDLASDEADFIAREMPEIPNAELFKIVAAEYDDPSLPIRVVFIGNSEEASVAHLLWKSKMAMEELKSRQSDRLSRLASEGGRINVNFVDGTQCPPEDFVLSSKESSNYNGKK